MVKTVVLFLYYFLALEASPGFYLGLQFLLKCLSVESFLAFSCAEMVIEKIRKDKIVIVVFIAFVVCYYKAI